MSQDSDRSGCVVLNNVLKTYLLGIEGVPALRGVNLTIEKGEFLVILGSSGGGKSSLLNLIGTIDRPTKGDITIGEHRLTPNSKDEELAQLRLQHIGFVFQTFNLIPSMSALENVSLPMILAGGLSSSSIRERATHLLTRVGLGNRLEHTPSQLSGGEQQRVTIARAIANKPQILLLDEPTGDLDTMNSTIILSLLVSLNRHDGITCIMVTHDQSLKYHANRVVHMLDGKILRIETIADEMRKHHDDVLRQNLAKLSSNPNINLANFGHYPSVNEQEQENENDKLLQNGVVGASESTEDKKSVADAPCTEIRDPSQCYPFLRRAG